MFMAASFVRAKKWKQPIWPSTVEQINGLRHTHTMGYYLVTKSKEVVIHAATQMNVRDSAK